MVTWYSTIVAAVAFVCTSPAPSYAASVSCGDLISDSVVLDHDLTKCPGNGLTVASSDVVVDLNGHTVAGGGSGGGIVIGERVSHVEVTNGSVRAFGTGVDITGDRATDIRVHDLAVSANNIGVLVAGRVRDVAIDRNKIRGSLGTGIGIGQPARDVTIMDNHIIDNGGDGLRVGEDTVRAVRGNFVARNVSSGVVIVDSVSEISENTLVDNGRYGLSLYDRFPWFIPHYVVAHNTADRNGVGGMIASADLAEPAPPAGDGNAAKHNGVFECVLIACAFNRGLASTHAPPAPSLLHASSTD
jgi:hypothetical protein